MDEIKSPRAKVEGTVFLIDRDKLDVRKLTMKLRSTSFRIVYSSLAHVRISVMKDNAMIMKFQEAGCFKYFVRFLKGSNEHILNLTLDILAISCGMLLDNPKLKEEVLKYGIVSKTVRVLKKVKSNAVQKRVFRLIGNLAQERITAGLLDEHIPNVILPILISTQDVGVKQAVVRALRYLWDCPFRAIMLNHQAVSLVATLLDSEDNKLLAEVIKALNTFASCCDQRIVAQMKGMKGCGYAKILSLIDLPNVKELIHHLTVFDNSRIELFAAGVTPLFVKIFIDGFNDHNLVWAFCHLCYEECFRAALCSTPMGFERVVSFIESDGSDLERKLEAVQQFTNNKEYLMKMLNLGLIDTIVKILDEFMKFSGNQQEKSMDGGADRVGYGNDFLPCAPPLQIWSLPHTDSTPNAYFHSHFLLEKEVQHEEEVETEMSSLSSNFDHVNLPEDYIIIAFLYGLKSRHGSLYQNRSVYSFPSKATITTLVYYLLSFWHTNKTHRPEQVLRVLYLLLEFINCFNSSVSDDSILLHRPLCKPRYCATDDGDCEQCLRMHRFGDHLVKVIQAGPFVARIFYNLAMTEIAAKSSLSLTIAYIIKDRSILHNSLIHLGLLECILGSLDSRISEAVLALHELFKALSIVYKRKKPCWGCGKESVRKEKTVTFELDDGSSVGANRESLAHQSPAFEAMFGGAFAESKQSRVKLRGVTSDCLKHLVRLTDACCSCQLNKVPLLTLLELFIVADMFLLTRLASRVLDFIMNQSLVKDCCKFVYNWSLDSKHPLAAQLSHVTLKFLFGSPYLQNCERVTAVRSMLQGHNRECFLKDITQLVFEALENYKKGNLENPSPKEAYGLLTVITGAEVIAKFDHSVNCEVLEEEFHHYLNSIGYLPIRLTYDLLQY